ncbi:ABC transporter ATP-binding protein [Miniphocaeibacter massiliensis]|uniref:ABC transporter ATP-binding protein n=1 Tax=Miniphocaeibacter massiliensis TaxID=2041841 RepID=UPI000C1BAAD6|nr:ABC transporter ATP-binding protein [Miniphocaeibacter massiliensis]
MEDKVLEFEHISFKYNEEEEFILKDVNLHLSSGEFVLLAGSSGGGKSTFLKCCNGSIPNSEKGIKQGTVKIYSEDIKEKKTSEISKQVGTVLQNADEQIIFEKVEDELAFPCENLHYKIDKIEKIIKEKSEFMNISLEDDTSTLSGGEKQSLITASTLCMEQRILILDEPLANLDYKASIKLLENLKYLCAKKNYTIIFIEHRLDLVLPYSDRVLWLENSEIKDFRNVADFSAFWKKKKEKIEGLVENNILNKVEKAEIRDSIKLLELRDLSFKVKEKTILKNINIDINKSDNWLIIGENGSGKTTLLKTISRFIKESSGDFKQNIVSNKRVGKQEWYKKVGIVFQNPNYQLYMPTVEQEIETSAKNKNLSQKVMKLFDLEKLKNKHPYSLSEGQKRKVGIASILAMDPEVLLLDEPTVGQDYEGLLMLIKALEELGYKNKTIITITHDVRIAHLLGNKILWIKDGKVYKKGGIEILEEYNKKE